MSDARFGSAPSLIAVLRDRGDEVQFNRALSLVCQQEPVARDFVKSVLTEAAQDQMLGRQARQELIGCPLGCYASSKSP